MKKIIGFVIVVALLAVGTPYLLGIQAKRVYEHTVDLIARESKLPFRVVDYKRGLFSSTAETAITINNMTLKIMHKIKHGPIIFDSSNIKPNGLEFGAALVQNSIVFDPEIPEYTEILKIFGDQDPFSWKSLIGFSGGMKTFMHSPAAEHSNNANGRTIVWQGLEGQVSNNKDYNALQGFITAPGITIKSADFNGGFTKFHNEFDQKRAQGNLWVGEGSSSIEKMEASAKESYVLDNFNLRYASKIENALYQGQFNFALNKAQTPEGVYGPIGIVVRLLNLDPEGISLLQSVMQNATIVPNLEALKPGLRQVLLKTPTLVIENTKLTLPEGEISIDSTLSIGGPNIPENFDDSIYSTTLTGDVKAIIGQAVLKKFLAMGMEKELKVKPEVAALSAEAQKVQLDKEVLLKIEKLKTIGILTEQGQNFELKFTIQQGKLMVNGKEVDVGTL